MRALLIASKTAAGGPCDDGADHRMYPRTSPYAGVRAGSMGNLRLLLTLALGPFLGAGCRPAGVGPIPSDIKGIQSGWVLDDAPGVDSGFQLSFDRYPGILPAITDLGAAWYRLEFRVTPRAVERARRRRAALGLAPECERRCVPEDLGWDADLLAAYGRALDDLRERHINVLGLVSNATIAASQAKQLAGSAEADSGDGDNAYIQNLGSVVLPMLLRRFGDRIHAWEIGNEPDVWTQASPYGAVPESRARPVPGGSFIYPSNFAQLLRRAFYAARAAEEEGVPPVALVSGGLLSMNMWNDDPASPGAGAGLFHNAAGVYLQAFVRAGFTSAGWGRIVQQFHRLPMDGWGLHLYVSQDTPDIQRDPWNNFGRYAAAFQAMTGAVAEGYLGAGHALPIWVTELGFGTPVARVPLDDRSDSLRAKYWPSEADGLELAYDCLAQLQTGAPVFWFTLFDVPNADIESGLFTPVWGTATFAPLTPKPAAARYRQIGVQPASFDCRRTAPETPRRRVRCKVQPAAAGTRTGEPFSGQCDSQ